MQELVLGIGGWRLLAALGIEPEVCHLNEGHAAFAVLERARSFMQASGQPLRRGAGGDARGQSVHHPYRGRGRLRPFRAGADRTIPRRLCRASSSASPCDDLLALGRQNPDDPTENSTWRIWRSVAAAP